MKLKLPVILFVSAILNFAQSVDNTDSLTYRNFSWENSKQKFGLEADPIPYFNQGYNFSFWSSYYLFKFHFDWSLKYPAEFVKAPGFEDLRYKSFAVQVQYFPIARHQELDKLWFGFGIARWSSKVKNSVTKVEGVFNNILLKFSVGYVVFVYDKLYLNPYLSGDLRMSGDKSPYIGGAVYNVQNFTPEISVRVGYHL